jgi:hypothetical protein
MQQPTIEWSGYRWFTMPNEPRAGIVDGVVRRVRVRTWAGCTVMPGEELSYPELCALERGGILIPLKTSPTGADRLTMMRAAAAWKPRHRRVGAGPPYARAGDAWFDAGANGTPRRSPASGTPASAVERSSRSRSGDSASTDWLDVASVARQTSTALLEATGQ